MLHIESPKGLSPTGVAPLFVMALLPFLVLAIAGTVFWPGLTRFPDRPDPVVVIGGVIWLLVGVAFWALTVRRFLRGFPRGELITDGTFAWCRNPLYASLIVFALPAVGLIAETWTFLALALIAAALALWLVPREERDLAKAFGPEWDGYLQRTGRLLPIPPEGWPRRAAGVAWVVVILLFLYVGALRPLQVHSGAVPEPMNQAASNTEGP